MSLKFPLFQVRLLAEWTYADSTPGRIDTVHSVRARSSKAALNVGLRMLDVMPGVADRRSENIAVRTTAEIVVRLCPMCKQELPAHATNCSLTRYAFGK